jgi:lipopolysaccharide transport system permease protein
VEPAATAPLRVVSPAFAVPGPLAPFACAARHRLPILQMARKEVLGRYRGSWLGVLWSLATPLLMLAVFTLVFGVALRARWTELAGAAEGHSGFALVLFSGLVVFWLFNDCVARAPRLVIEHREYVKRTLFPLEILPLAVAASALFHFAVSLAVLLVARVFVLGWPPATALLLPLVLLPFLLLVLGLCWLLAALGVFLRDLGHAIGIAISAALFLSPVFYPVSVFPEWLRPALYANPLTLAIEQTRDVLLWGRLPDWPALALSLAAGWALAWLGLAAFAKSRRAFADVL